MHKVREALALLAAVARVDPSAWKYLLREKCNVRMGKKGQEKHESEVPVEFLLEFELTENKKTKDDETLGLDSLIFFGTSHRTEPSAEYVRTLARIAKMDTRLKSRNPGVNIEIPVQVLYRDQCGYKDAPKNLLNSGKAEKAIRAMWTSLGEEPVKARSLQCTFVLKTMVLDYDGLPTAKMVKTMETLMADNISFSQVATYLSSTADATGRKALACFLRTLFGADSDSTEVFNSGDTAIPRQLSDVKLECDRMMGSWEYGAVFSDMMLNSTTRTLSMFFNSEDDQDRRKMWMWLAYAAFSKRGRGVEEFTLTDIKDMKTEEMEVFASVMMSDHPEEVLFDCPRGQVAETKATLSKGTKLRWKTDEHGALRQGSRAVALPSTVRDVTTFSDDGESDFVNVLISGFGHCLVQRDDLAFQETEHCPVPEQQLMSLTIQFDKDSEDDELEDNNDDDNEESERNSERKPPDTAGLGLFLEKIGSTLKSLALDGPREDLDDNLITRSCPNLQKLSLCGGIVDVQLRFDEYRLWNRPIPTLTCHWHDIAALSAALSDTTNPLANCVRQLRVQLKDEWDGWQIVPQSYNPPDFESNAKVLLLMLDNNQRLEYLEVIAPEEHDAYLEKFSSHHLKAIKRPLEQLIKCHIPFLSVISWLTQPTKKQKASSSNLTRVMAKLDQHIVANIIKFAVDRSLRQVYYRSQDGTDWDYEGEHHFLRI